MPGINEGQAPYMGDNEAEQTVIIEAGRLIEMESGNAALERQVEEVRALEDLWQMPEFVPESTPAEDSFVKFYKIASVAFSIGLAVAIIWPTRNKDR